MTYGSFCFLLPGPASSTRELNLNAEALAREDGCPHAPPNKTVARRGWRSPDGDLTDHTGVDCAVVRKCPGGLQGNGKSAARCHASRVPPLDVRRGSVRHRVRVRPCHGRADGDVQLVGHEGPVAESGSARGD